MHAQLNTGSLPVPAADGGRQCASVWFLIILHQSWRGSKRGRVSRSQTLSAGFGRGHSVVRSEWGRRAPWVELEAQAVVCVPTDHGVSGIV